MCRFTTNVRLLRTSVYYERKMTPAKKSTRADLMRFMAAHGHSVETIAVSMAAKPNDVRRVLAREPGCGRPRHVLTWDQQLEYARRIAESTSNAKAKELALILVDELLRGPRTHP
jgi:hypothetical protein